MLSGPFKVVLSALERNSSPDTLGDPTAARVRNELGRLFQLDDDTASNIVSAVPIVILDGLDVRAAGVVRDRLQGLREAGCRVVITDEVTDTIPRVNWPQLPPIARVERGGDDEPSGRHRRSSEGGGLACPHCGGGLQVLAAGGPPPGELRQAEPRPVESRSASREVEPAPATRGRQEAWSGHAPPAREPEPVGADDDWLSPPVGAVAAAPPPPPGGRRQSGRFDDAAMLAFRRAEEPARTTSAATTSEVLEVSFSDSGELEPAAVEELRRAAAEPRRAEPRPMPETAPELLDSGVFEEPRGRSAASTSARRPEPAPELPVFEEPRGRSSSSARRPEPAPELLDSGVFEEPRGRSVSSASARRPEPAPELLDSGVFEEPRGRSASSASARRPEPAPELLDSGVFEEPRGRSASTSSARRPEPAPTPPPPPPARGAEAGRSGRGKAPDPFEDSLAGLDPAPVVRSGADPFASSPSRSGASGRGSAPELDPFEDSRVLDDLAGLGGGKSGGKAGGKAGRDPLEDSGSDILDEPPPHRRSDASRPGGERFESDLDLFDDGELGASDVAPAPTSRRAPPAAPSGRDLPGGGDDLQLLDSDERAPPPAAKPRKGGAGGGRSGARSPDLDEVLNMFGPEDDAPLDDGSGLEPAPLDLSPPSRGGGGGGGARPARGSERAAFDPELSDILEPLDPGEALEIIKTSKPGRREAASAQGRPAANGRHARDDEPSGLEQLDMSEAGALQSEVKHERRPAKKSRGVPFPATDEDVDLFEESSRSGRPQKKKTDPFARARGRMVEEDEGRDRRSGGGGGERERRGNEASGAVERPRVEARAEAPRPSAPAPAKRPPPGGAAPSGEGEHGLVLSRIADPEKKEQAAEIIAEVKGCSIDEARRLTDRTIIPVLKGVSRELAEHHLEKFKRVKIAGRVTTRQRG
ncbi:MAG: hypothetical protein KF878_10315 [Planctomycetes bacterium]|nr:hypothetical protein [Planctomycetota bacterium]